MDRAGWGCEEGQANELLLCLSKTGSVWLQSQLDIKGPSQKNVCRDISPSVGKKISTKMLTSSFISKECEVRAQDAPEMVTAFSASLKQQINPIHSVKRMVSLVKQISVKSTARLS